MSVVRLLANLLALLVLPFVLTGIIQRVKSWWSGRRGPKLLQSAHDVLRLLRKAPVYGATATPLFRIAPWFFLVSALGAALVLPVAGLAPVAAFDLDFIWLAYLGGLGRVALLLAALDTGSSFEGMGAAREATFATLFEPALFLVVGALSLGSGARSLYDVLAASSPGSGSLLGWLASAAGLFVLLQVETGRIPVDDPSTHLELTMLREVMVLDHAGAELALVQYGNALGLLASASLVASLVNPFLASGGALAVGVQLGLYVLLALCIGSVESLIARLGLRAVPQYIAFGLLSGAVALLAAAAGRGGTP